MADNNTLTQNSLIKGKALKEFSDALKDLNLCAFHQGVLVDVGTALQYLASSLFLQLGKYVLLCRDFYFDQELLSGQVVSMFGIQSQAVTSVWVGVSQVPMLKACPNMTLAVEQDVKPQL